jgi:hypothetical protein
MVAVAGHRRSATGVLTGQNPTVSTAGFEPVSEGGPGHRDVGAVLPRVSHVGEGGVVRAASCPGIGSQRAHRRRSFETRARSCAMTRRMSAARHRGRSAAAAVDLLRAGCWTARLRPGARGRSRPHGGGPEVPVELPSWSSLNDGGTSKVRAGAGMRCSHSSGWGRSASPRWLGVWSAPRRLGASRSCGSSHGWSGRGASSKQRHRPVPHGQRRRGTVPVSPCGVPSVGRA